MQPEIKKRRNINSLTFTLAVAFLTLSFIVLMIASGLETYFSIQNQRKTIAEQQNLIAKEAASTVKNFIQEKFRVLHTTVKIDNPIIASKEKQKLILDKILGFEPAFRQLAVLDKDGQPLLLVSRLSNWTPTKFGKELSNDFLPRIVQDGSYIGKIQIDEASSEPLVIIAAPVKDTLGDFNGIIMAEVNLKFMWDVVNNIEIGKDGLAYVVDRQGNLIAFGDVTRVLSQENLINLEAVNNFVINKHSLKSDKAEISNGILGTKVVATHFPLNNPDWAVIVEMPILEAYETVILDIKLTLLTMLLSFLLAIFTGIYLSKRITKPLINLRDAVIKIGENKLDTKIEVKTKDEIGELAFQFNTMTDMLRKSRGELEDYSKNLENKVEEKTMELKQKIDELEKFNKIAVGRELKMIELKRRVKELEDQSGNNNDNAKNQN